MIPRLNWQSLSRDPGKWEKNVKLRRASCSVPDILSTYKSYREQEEKRQTVAQERNRLSCSPSPSHHQGRQMRSELDSLDAKLRELANELAAKTIHLPNDSHPDVPLGEDRVILQFNQDRLGDAPQSRDHLELLREKGWISDGSTSVAGAGFISLKNTGAALEHALVNYALKFATDRGFTLLTVPDLVSEEVVEGSGFAPRPSPNTHDPVYRTSDGLVLAGTAELPLLALHRRQYLGEFPVKLVAVGHSFRRECGHYGTDARGLFRLHQFTKVELFQLSHPAHSDSDYERLCAAQIDLVRSLGLPGRQLEMRMGELGPSAYRKRDVELWFPHSKRWGEVTSASHCTDYQARRMDIRVKGEAGSFVHTMNATGIAVPRIIQCIAEWGGDPPKVLQRHLEYLGFT